MTGSGDEGARLQDILNSALALLARREYGRHELCRKLLTRGHDPEAIEQVVEQLVQRGQLSDQRFTEAFVRSRSTRGYGPQRIRAELGERRLDDTLAREELTGIDWVTRAREVRQKRFGAALPTDYTERAKQMRFLQYRGFSIEQIRAAFSWNEDE